MNLRKMARALVVAALASALVYAVLIAVTDGRKVAEALRGFPLAVLALMLLLTLAGYVLRGLRWGWFMRLLGHPVRRRDGVYIQLSGLTMSVSPGRIGEVLKAWLSREVASMPISRGFALVFTERVADLLAVSLLSIGGISVLGGGMLGLVGMLVALVLAVAVVSSAWFHDLALRLLSRQRWARRHHESAKAISEAVRLALTWRVLAFSVPVSLVAWGAEGIGFYLILRALGSEALDVAAAVSTYAVSTIVGAFSFLPGGIGLTEASMAGILVAAGVPAPSASAATLLVRVCTLWWGVVIGWAALLSRRSVLKSLLAANDENLAED